MGFVAGYVSKAGRLDPVVVRERVGSFRILDSDDPSSYETQIIPTASGHLIHFYKADHPLKTKTRLGDQGVLVMLGFHTAPCELTPASLLSAEGEFVSMLYKADTRTLHIINDRFAVRPFYFMESAGMIYFSSNLAFLFHFAGRIPASDILGWFQTFGCNHTVGTRTTYQGVTRMAPATHVTIDDQARMTSREYWKLRFEPADIGDPSEFSRQVYERFKAGAEFRAGFADKGLLALSGGLDSRLVAASIPRDKFTAFTIRTSGGESEVAAQVAGRLGFAHDIRAIEPAAYSTVAHDVARLTGGMRPFHHVAIVYEYIKHMKATGRSFLMGGGPGDIMAGSKIPSFDYCHPELTAVCLRDYVHKFTPDADGMEVIFKPDVVHQYRREAAQSFTESLENAHGPTAAHKVTAWAMANRWPAFTFTSLMHTHPDAGEAFPHLDYGFADLMLKLPARLLYNRNFYSYMIYHSLPDLREIIYSNTGKLLAKDLMDFKDGGHSVKHIQRYSHNLMRDLMPRYVVRLHRPMVTPRGSDRYVIDSELREEVAERLDSLSDVLNLDSARKFVITYGSDKLRIAAQGQSELIGNLTTMAFCGN